VLRMSEERRMLCKSKEECYSMEGGMQCHGIEECYVKGRKNAMIGKQECYVRGRKNAMPEEGRMLCKRRKNATIGKEECYVRGRRNAYGYCFFNMRKQLRVYAMPWFNKSHSQPSSFVIHFVLQYAGFRY
jgi:hypothetical protein